MCWDELCDWIAHEFSAVKELVLIPHRWLHLLPLHALPRSHAAHHCHLVKALGGSLPFPEPVEGQRQTSTQSPPCEPSAALRQAQGAEGSQGFIAKRNGSDAEHGNERGRCLLDDYTVRYAPSLQILQQIQQRGHVPYPSTGSGHRPSTGSGNGTQRWFAVQNPTNDLSFADIEVMALTGLFPASAPADVLVQQAATRSAVLQHPALRQAPVLHFSCHGGFNPIDPMQSALLLANNELLTLQDIFAQRLPNAHLVTLSACETGMTDFQFEGDEYLGLSSGFLSAGARHVISTLWSVNQVSTMLLLLRFYHQWLNAGATDIAPTLKAAQRWLRQATVQELLDWALPLLPAGDCYNKVKVALAFADDKPYQSPFHWAAFCAVG